MDSIIHAGNHFFSGWKNSAYFDPLRAYENAIPVFSCNTMPGWLKAFGEATVTNFTPCEFWDSMTFLAITLVLLAAIWYSTVFFWSQISVKFRSIQPKHKQWYVVANMSKAIMLGLMAMSPYWTYGVFRSYALGDWTWHVKMVKRSCAFYLATDVLALFMVPKLPSTTIVHHVVATLLTMSIFVSDLAHSEVPKMIGIYGCWSTVAYPVNLYLALRVMYDKRTWADVLASAALLTYVLCCLGNWTWHTWWFINKAVAFELTAPILIYMLSIVSVVRDDIILMTWLWRRGTGKSTDREVFIKKRTVKCAAENVAPLKEVVERAA